VTRLGVLLLVLTMTTPALAQPPVCNVHPQSALRLDAPVAPVLIEHTASRADIERLSGSPPPHSLMAMAYSLDAQVRLVDEPTTSTPNKCPDESVTVTFGIGRRDVFLASEVARVPCVRQALLDHEESHYTIVQKGAEAFLNGHRSDLAQILESTRKLPAAKDVGGRRQLEHAMLGILKSLSDDFRVEMRGPLREEADSPTALSLLARACNGAIGDMDRATGTPL